MKRNDLIRIALTTILLIIVWRNVHWSVAACLTLNAISWEALAYTMRRIATAISLDNLRK